MGYCFCVGLTSSISLPFEAILNKEYKLHATTKNWIDVSTLWVESCTSYLSVMSQISNYWYGLSAWHTTKMVPGCFPQKARWIAVPSQSHQVPTPSQLNATYCDSTSLERQTIYIRILAFCITTKQLRTYRQIRQIGTKTDIQENQVKHKH